MAKGEWASGLDRHLGEMNGSQPAQRCYHVIGFAHGDPARGKDQIGFQRRFLQRGGYTILPVRNDAQINHLHVEVGEHAMQGIAVTVVDLALFQGFPNTFDFVAA